MLRWGSVELNPGTSLGTPGGSDAELPVTRRPWVAGQRWGSSRLGGGGGGDVARGVHVGNKRLGAAADGSVALKGREEGRRSGRRGCVVVQGNPPAGAGTRQGDCVLVPVHRGIVRTQPGGSENKVIAHEIEDMEVCPAKVGIGARRWARWARRWARRWAHVLGLRRVSSGTPGLRAHASFWRRFSRVSSGAPGLRAHAAFRGVQLASCLRVSAPRLRGPLSPQRHTGVVR